MKDVRKLIAAMAAALLAGQTYCLANGRSAADHAANSVDSADEYSAAVQNLHDAEADVVRAREQGIREMQARPEYLSAAKDLDTAYAAFNDKRNALLGDLEKKDPRCGPMKKRVVDIDAEIDAARQNPATTPEWFDQHYKDRATFVHQWDEEVDSAIKRENLEPLRQQWQGASDKLAAMQNQQRLDVENSDKVKNAKAVVAVDRAAADQARATLQGPPPSADAQQDQADDYLRRFPRFGFGGKDAWLTYGWSPLYSAAAKATPPK
jgi:hypothetical protein